jgi:hypothetical protein
MFKGIQRIVMLLTGVAFLSLALAPRADAHPLNTSAVPLDVGAHDVAATIDLPLDQLSVAQNRTFTAADVVLVSAACRDSSRWLTASDQPR